MANKTEVYSDDEGNSITIEESSDGVYVSADIKTKLKYTGGANASSARAYAKKNGLKKQ